MLSAFNGLTLSRALAALLLRPRKPSGGLLQRLFGGFSRLFERITHRYVTWSEVLIKKGVFVVVLLLVFGVAAGVFSSRVPTSFLPDEDQGYAYVNVQLPDTASLTRTSAVVEDVDNIIRNTPGVQNSTCFIGFSLLSFVHTSYNATFVITFKPWDERPSRDQQFQTLKAHLDREFSKLPAAVAVWEYPPAIQWF